VLNCSALLLHHFNPTDDLLCTTTYELTLKPKKEQGHVLKALNGSALLLRHFNPTDNLLCTITYELTFEKLN